MDGLVDAFQQALGTAVVRAAEHPRHGLAPQIDGDRLDLCTSNVNCQQKLCHVCRVLNDS